MGDIFSIALVKENKTSSRFFHSKLSGSVGGIIPFLNNLRVLETQFPWHLKLSIEIKTREQKRSLRTSRSVAGKVADEDNSDKTSIDMDGSNSFVPNILIELKSLRLS